MSDTPEPLNERARFQLGDGTAEMASIKLAGGTAVGLCRRNPAKETANEDCIMACGYGQDALILAVADGAGGLPAGHRASNLAIQALQDSLGQSHDQQLLLRTAVLNGIEAANRAVMALSNGSATTLTIMAIDNATARPFHVGDSPALIVGQRGKVKLQTIPHSPTGFAVEAGFLDEAEALFHEERHLVSNFIGNDEMRIEVGKTHVLARRDTVLVASDGLFDNLRVPEIIQVIRAGDLHGCMTQLERMAGERMTQPGGGHPCKPDDLGIVMFRRD